MMLVKSAPNQRTYWVPFCIFTKVVAYIFRTTMKLITHNSIRGVITHGRLIDNNLYIFCINLRHITIKVLQHWRISYNEEITRNILSISDNIYTAFFYLTPYFVKNRTLKMIEI